MGRAYEALFALLWQALPYRTPVIGWRSDVEKATVEVCREFFATYYAPNNIVIVDRGRLRRRGRARAHRAHLRQAARRPRQIPRNPTEEPEQRGERRAVVHFDVRGPLLAAALARARHRAAPTARRSTCCR